jgi:hypothetical protein
MSWTFAPTQHEEGVGAIRIDAGGFEQAGLAIQVVTSKLSVKLSDSSLEFGPFNDSHPARKIPAHASRASDEAKMRFIL